MTGKAQTIDEFVARALGPYEDRPDAVAVARLVGDLIVEGQELHAAVAALPADRRTGTVGAALVEWSYFVDAGPRAGGDHANWNHARGLARILRTLARALDEHRSSSAR